MNQNSEEYDVFISYSSKDKKTADRIAGTLKNIDLSVWYDNWEILVGHDIVSEVYKGIRQSRFLVVLLSKNALESQWVKEEISRGKLKEIEDRRITVLPALIEDCKHDEIPETLRTKKYANFTDSFENGMRELLTAVLTFSAETRGTQAVLERPKETEPVKSTEIQPNNNKDTLRKFVSRCESEMNSYGWVKGEAYREWLIVPAKSYDKLIPKHRIEDILKDIIVKTVGWGGAPFPYDWRYPTCRILRLMDGIEVVDDAQWPSEDWTFHFWSMSERGFFLARDSLIEDHLKDGKRKGTLALEWVIMDIARSLQFAQRLCQKIPNYSAAQVSLTYEGTKDRKLVMLSGRSLFFSSSYQAGVPNVKVDAIVRGDTDLLETALTMTKDVCWMFGFTFPNEKALINAIRQLLNGKFPDWR